MRSVFCSLFFFFAFFLGLLNSEEGLEVLPTTSNNIGIVKDGKPYIRISHVAWAENWKYIGLKGTIVEETDQAILTNTGKIGTTGAELSIQTTLIPSGDRWLIIEDYLNTNGTAPITLISLLISPVDEFFDKGKVLVELENGESKTVDFPLNRKNLDNKNPVKSFTLIDNEGTLTKFSMTPALTVPTDKGIRIALADKEINQNKPINAQVVVGFPKEYTFYPGPNSVSADQENENWFTFHSGANHQKKNSIGMNDWLEKPAGKHGRIKMQDRKLMYNDQEIKLWGLNLTYMSGAPNKKDAEQKAEFYAKYGINAVRLHKFSDGAGWQGIQTDESVLEFDPEKLDKLDYFVAQLKENGIYIKLSFNFILNVAEGDGQYIPYLDEFKNAFGIKNKRVQTKHGSIFLSQELQDLQIQQIKNILNHKNPYTGLTYAQDPAIFMIEMYNEDDAFFNTMVQFKKIPTLRQRTGILFTNWLEQKYGTEDSLIESWGNKALNSFGYEGLVGENWDEKTIIPIGNAWYYDPTQLNGSQKHKKQRLLDSMQFLYELQNKFYSRFKEELKSTGYDGEMISSNWIAGNGPSHFFNLHSDSLIGTIDRHNYFGGLRQGGEFVNTSMLSSPGSNILSLGLQQVSNRPFMVSEWVILNPTEWSVEGPAIIGAYGMGLQGWDVSFIFQNKDVGKINNKFVGKWQVDKPTVIGLFPAVSRQVLRGDVEESKFTIPLYVDMQSVAEGELDFKNFQEVKGDIKSYSTDKVPHEALAVGRVVVEFNDENKSTPTFNLADHTKDGFIESSTDQLKWKNGSSEMDGYFTINTEGTKAVVGFANGSKSELGNVTIQAQSRFGAIYVTALNKDETIDTDTNLLITAIARVRQTGMKVFEDLYLVEKGSAPFVMEPVKATIKIDKKERKNPVVYILDHDGVRTEETIPIEDGVIQIDTGRDTTPYYEVVYES